MPKGYHVLLTQDGVYYSVPHRFVGQRVEMRRTSSKVEVFCGGERIATHVRDRTKQRGESVTAPEHRARSHADFLDHDSGWYRREAQGTGPSTLRVVEAFLAAGSAEEQGWGWCEKLLSKRGAVGASALEEACATALSVTAHPSYKAVNMLLRNMRRKTKQPQASDAADYAIRRFK